MVGLILCLDLVVLDCDGAGGDWVVLVVVGD